MKLYEHEAKAILLNLGVPTPKGSTVTTSQQARETAANLGKPVVVKAQILVAGRGKAGGIQFADTPEEAEEAAKNLLGTKLKDTIVHAVLIEEKLRIRKELYFGLTIDRFNRCYVAVSSQVGGVDIEEVAQIQPEKIHTIQIDPYLGFHSFHARQIAKQLGYIGDQMIQLANIFEKLFIATVDYDAELIEINPLVETEVGTFLAADARIILDDNSLFRHLEYKKKQLEEPRELSPQEFEASKEGLAYVKLDGNIGVVGNGAGLVMATLDIINLFGGKPANFLDMGGGAPPEKIEVALRIILSDPQVKVLFVNILGGITLCDEVARGLIQARNQLRTSKPMVIRLMGSNEAEGKRILVNAALSVFDSMEDASRKAVELAQKEQ